MKTLSTLLLLLFVTALSHAQDPFVTVWNTENPGLSEDDQIYFSATGNFDFIWVDLNDEEITGNGSGSNGTTITFPAPGIYELSIFPTGTSPFSSLNFSPYPSWSDARKLIEVRNWGDVAWSSFWNAFANTSNLIITATDVPNLSDVTDMTRAFYKSGVGTIPNINDWDVSGVTSMASMFFGSNFNQHIGEWDVSQVTNMDDMFRETPFNQPIGDWDVSNVTLMNRVFLESNFNQPIGNWDVSSVTDMRQLFQSTPFNQPIGNWDVSSVTTMRFMFAYSEFNQPVGEWDMGNVTSIYAMFKDTEFNHPIGDWDVSNVFDMCEAFMYTPFNQPIGDWDVSGAGDLKLMFYDSEFNQPIGDWDVSNAGVMRYMFSHSPFNQPIGDWDVSKVYNMTQMFSHSQFNQPIGDWDVSKVIYMEEMFYDSDFNQPLDQWDLNVLSEADRMFKLSGMTCENYSLTLQGWANNPNTNTGVSMIGNTTMKYSPNVVDDRAYLTSVLNWTITNDVLGECLIPTSVDEYSAERLRVYPNPTKGTVFIEPLQALQNATLSLYDLHGRRVMQFEMSDFNSDFRLSLDPLDQGVYLLRVEADKFRYATRIVKF